MTTKEVKQLLKEWALITPIIECKKRELTRIMLQKYELCNPKSTRYDKICVQGGHHDGVFEKVWDLSVNFDILISGITAEINSLLEKKTKIEKMVSALDYGEQYIINLRFFQLKGWAAISVITGYSLDHPRKILDKALRNIVQSEAQINEIC